MKLTEQEYREALTFQLCQRCAQDVAALGHRTKYGLLWLCHDCYHDANPETCPCLTEVG